MPGPNLQQAGQITPLVSIIIPYYNQQAYLTDTVDSVIKSGYAHIEIIVVDDGSPIPAHAVLGNREDVTIVRTENRGCAAARNYGFHKSSGEYLIFLDSDDRLVPGAIDAHLSILRRHPDAVLSFGAIRLIDEHNREIRAPHICRPRRDYFLMLLEGNPIGCPGSVMVKRQPFLNAGLYDESLRVVEDYLLYLQLARTSKLVQHSACVVEYRFHSSSISQNKERMLAVTLSILDKVEKEMPLTPREKRKLIYGRRRWTHAMRPRQTLTYRLTSLYYSFRALLTVSPSTYFRSDRTTP